jgi:hypothetical protein
MKLIVFKLSVLSPIKISVIITVFFTFLALLAFFALLRSAPHPVCMREGFLAPFWLVVLVGAIPHLRDRSPSKGNLIKASPGTPY